MLHFTLLSWLPEGAGKSHLVIKTSAHIARLALLLGLFSRARFVCLHRRPIDSIRSLAQVKHRLAHLVGLQELPSSLWQVEEIAAAHDQWQEAFARSQHLIRKGKLVEIAYDDLVQSPLITMQRIYSALEICGWDSACDASADRIAEGKGVEAQPVVPRRPPERPH